MIELLKTYKIELSPENISILAAHLRFVLEKNREINLTSITDHENALILHVVDSLLVLPELEAAPAGKMLDMGSGAGYPGIPLAVATRRQTTLLDSRKKKVQVIQEFLSQHPELSFCTAEAARAEDYALTYREGFSVVVTRALAVLPVLLELASPLLPIGGQLIALKGRLSTDERTRAEKLYDATGMGSKSHRAYPLPSGEHREAVVYEKMKPAQIGLPRQVGRAQRSPLA